MLNIMVKLVQVLQLKLLKLFLIQVLQTYGFQPATVLLSLVVYTANLILLNLLLIKLMDQSSMLLMDLVASQDFSFKMMLPQLVKKLINVYLLLQLMNQDYHSYCLNLMVSQVWVGQKSLLEEKLQSSCKCFNKDQYNLIHMLFT